MAVSERDESTDESCNPRFDAVVDSSKISAKPTDGLVEKYKEAQVSAVADRLLQYEFHSIQEIFLPENDGIGHSLNNVGKADSDPADDSVAEATEGRQQKSLIDLLIVKWWNRGRALHLVSRVAKLKFGAFRCYL